MYDHRGLGRDLRTEWVDSDRADRSLLRVMMRYDFWLLANTSCGDRKDCGAEWECLAGDDRTFTPSLLAAAKYAVKHDMQSNYLTLLVKMFRPRHLSSPNHPRSVEHLLSRQSLEGM